MSNAVTRRSPYSGASAEIVHVANWRPGLRSADADILRDAPTLRARARDLVRNNATAQQAVRISRISTVGAQMRLKLRPDWQFLGISYEAALAWSRVVERAWEEYAHGPHFWLDAGRRMTFTDFMNLVHDTDIIDGETLVVAEWDESRPWSTCFQAVDVDRLSNPAGKPETAWFKAGVELNQHGAPIAYHIRNAHPSEYGIVEAAAQHTHSRIDRETAWFRPICMHSFALSRAGQTRGVTEFASVLSALKMAGEYSEAVLETAIGQAQFVAFITSDASVAKMAEALGGSIDPESGEEISPAQQQFAESIEYTNALDIRVRGAKIPKLAQGDKIEIAGSKHPTSGHGEFLRTQQYAVAQGLGVDPIALTQDYSKANYASNKMSAAHNGRAAETRRARLVRTIAMPMFGCWLEEAIMREAVDMPEGLSREQFYAARGALCRGTFLTASKAILEPARERQAQQIGRQLGLETLESMAAEEGEDWRDNLEQIARENAEAAELGVFLAGMPMAVATGGMPGIATPPAAPAGDDAADDSATDSSDEGAD